MKKILVVDNDALILEFMNDVLTEAGHQVTTANDGLAALDILKGYTPDVMFVDLVMPNIGGKKLCEIIRGTDELKRIPVIILSGIAAEENLDISAMGADACIPKGPFDEMAEDIRVALEQTELPASDRVFTDFSKIRRKRPREITKELLSVKRHFEITLERMAEGIVEMTSEGRIVYANSAAVSLMGILEEDLLGSSFDAMFLGEDSKRIGDLLKTEGDKSRAITDESPANLFGHQVTIDIIPIEGDASSIIAIINDVTIRKETEIALRKAHDELEQRVNERTLELVEVNDELKQEIEERKQVEKALLSSEEKYRSILESMEEGYFELDLDGTFIFFNRSLCEMMGYPDSELMGMNALECCTRETADKTVQILEEMRQKKRPVGLVDFEAITKKGDKILLEMSISLMQDNLGYTMGYRVVARDTSEKRKLRAQLLHAQKMESIGTIASGVAHNFRNILSGISVNNQLIEMKYKEEPSLKEITSRVDKEVERGVDLISRLMQFSHEDQTKDFKVVNLNEAIQETYELISRSFDKKIDIQLDLHESLLVLGDHSGLTQVIMNLCTNARDAMPNGGNLSIEARKEGNNARVVVSDTGTGMDPETTEKCFDPFFTTKDIDTGTGLGLSTTYGIVKDHGGDIYVYSEIDKGTAFKVDLPLVQFEETLGQEAVAEVIRGKGEKVLVVDDEIDSLKPMEDLLEGMGYRAASSGSGKEAIAKYSSWQPDVVLVDRNMPEMDGVTCAEKIIANDPDAKIILISGYDEKGPNGIGLPTQELIGGYLVKPINRMELSRMLSRLCGG